MPASPPAESSAQDAATGRTITLAGGCFWCVEAAMTALDGVLAATSGYAQGHVPHPGYAQVCAGDTGHAEAVRVRYDPHRLSLAHLLEVFFTIHDPTTLNRQGADVGSQYRSGVYFEHAEDEAQIRAVLHALQQAGAFGGATPVTEIEALRHFWPAETEHQRYFEHHPEQGYCRVVIQPKLAKLHRDFGALLRAVSDRR